MSGSYEDICAVEVPTLYALSRVSATKAKVALFKGFLILLPVIAMLVQQVRRIF